MRTGGDSWGEIEAICMPEANGDEVSVNIVEISDEWYAEGATAEIIEMIEEEGREEEEEEEEEKEEEEEREEEEILSESDVEERMTG